MNKNDFIYNKAKTVFCVIAFLAIPFTTAFVMLGGIINSHLRLVALFVLFLLLVSAVLSLIFLKRNFPLILTVLFLIFIALVRCLPEYVYNNKKSEAFTKTYQDSEHVFSGYIVRGDAETSSGMYVRVDSVDGVSLKYPVDAYCYNRSGNYYSEGTYIEISCNIREPVSYSDSFDFAEWLSLKGVHCELYNISDIKTDYTKDRQPTRVFLSNAIYENSFKMLKNISGKEAFEKGTALAKALLTGDRSGFSGEWLEWFSGSGMTHLLCVSGLHFTVMLGGFSAIIKLFVKNRSARKALLLLVSVLYLCVCGFSKSAMRSALMAFLGASSVGAGSKTVSKLLVAVSVICVIDPLAIRDISFHLSVLSCGGIACLSFLSEVIKKKLEYRPVISSLFDVLSMSFGAFAFTFAYSACAFGKVSTVSVITSVLSVIPVQICLVILWISVILGMLNAEPLLLMCTGIYARLSEYTYNVAQTFSRLAYASVQTSMPNISLSVFLIMLGVLACTAFSKATAAKIYFYALIISVTAVIILLQIS